MKKRSGPQAGTRSGGRCCSQTWRAATASPPAAKSASAPPYTMRPARAGLWIAAITEVARIA